jgi:hypothetical protein
MSFFLTGNPELMQLLNKTTSVLTPIIQLYKTQTDHQKIVPGHFFTDSFRKNREIKKKQKKFKDKRFFLLFLYFILFDKLQFHLIEIDAFPVNDDLV